jgi:hypothetical protein
MRERYEVPTPPGSELKHQGQDISVRAIVWFGVVLFITAIVVHVAMGLMFWWMAETQVEKGASVSKVSRQQYLPPAPRLQVNPSVDMEALHNKEDARLKGYRWVDQTTGTVQIPIERAMDIISERGIPKWAGAAKQAPAAQQSSLPAKSGQGAADAR